MGLMLVPLILTSLASRPMLPKSRLVTPVVLETATVFAVVSKSKSRSSLLLPPLESSRIVPLSDTISSVVLDRLLPRFPLPVLSASHPTLSPAASYLRI